MITVINRRRSSFFCGVYVGRPSPLGNPYCIGIDGSRREVIVKYRAWLSAQLEDEHTPQSREILRLLRIAKRGNLTLVCWCKPLACHADVIKEKLEWLLGEHT